MIREQKMRAKKNEEVSDGVNLSGVEMIPSLSLCLKIE